MAQQPQQLKALFCKRFDCPPEEYAEHAFRKCLYAHAKPLVGILRLWNADFFFEDLKFIEAMGVAVDSKEVRADAANFRDVNRHGRGFLRTAWRLRVSGRKAMRMARDLFSTAGEPLLAAAPQRVAPRETESASTGPRQTQRELGRPAATGPEPGDSKR
jgi:hypothetical protein